jgi:hypothetical protein
VRGAAFYVDDFFLENDNGERGKASITSQMQLAQARQRDRRVVREAGRYQAGREAADKTEWAQAREEGKGNKGTGTEG